LAALLPDLAAAPRFGAVTTAFAAVATTTGISAVAAACAREADWTAAAAVGSDTRAVGLGESATLGLPASPAARARVVLIIQYVLKTTARMHTLVSAVEHLKSLKKKKSKQSGGSSRDEYS
jgi:hypothetical protein